MTPVIPQPPDGPICDFCSDPNVVAAYPARDFSRAVEATPLSLNSEGGWAACQTCHDLIEKGDRDALCNHSVERFGISVMPRHAIATAIRSVQDSFWSQREGQAIPASRDDREDPTR